MTDRGGLRRSVSVLASGAVLVALCVAASAAFAGRIIDPPQRGPLRFTASVDPIGPAQTQPLPVKLNLGLAFFGPDAKLEPRQTAQLSFRLGRGLVLSAAGLPACAVRIQIQAAGPGGLPERCKTAKLGSGVARLSLPTKEGGRSEVRAQATVFNGGRKDGTPRFWLYVPVELPVPNAVLAPIELRPAMPGEASPPGAGKQSAIGEEAILKLPPIASGQGWLSLLELHLGRTYRAEGKRRSIVALSCPVRQKINFSAEAQFSDGTTARSRPVIQPC